MSINSYSSQSLYSGLNFNGSSTFCVGNMSELFISAYILFFFWHIFRIMKCSLQDSCHHVSACKSAHRKNMRSDLSAPVSYTHLRAHETRHDLVCRLLLEKK